MMKVLLVDPWGVNNTAEYLNGLIMGLSRKVELVVFTNRFFELREDVNAELHKVFFPKSENMRHGKLRSYLRGIEYIQGYEKTISYIKRNPDIDIVHFNWLLFYGIDIKYLNRIKNMGKKIVYTAHNVVPNFNITEKKRDQLRIIYSICDRIVLHGYNIGEEFRVLFPEYYPKVYFQKHGSNINPNVKIDETVISPKLVRKVETYKRKYLYFGKIFYNKGVDRLIQLWNPEWKSSALVIAGRTEEKYQELDTQLSKANEQDNIIFINKYIDDNTLNYLIYNCNLIILPYRHASMSGVIFTAADFSKPVMCTNVGALPEYIENGVDGFLCDNSDQAILDVIKHIKTTVTDKELEEMGRKLHDNIYEKCSWHNVASKLVDECYSSVQS